MKFRKIKQVYRIFTPQKIYNIFRMFFSNNTSQLGADKFVLSNFKNKGYFVEVGAFDGKLLSNTYLLEKKGWTGICIDPFPRNFEKRKCIVEEAACYCEKDLDLDFVIHGALSGILQTCGLHKDHIIDDRASKIIKIKTVLLSDVLIKNQSPKFIEYLSLDTEGSEYEILISFPFDKYRFGIISVEHNFEEPKRSLIRELLYKNGYVLSKSVEWDDWYINTRQ